MTNQKKKNHNYRETVISNDMELTSDSLRLIPGSSWHPSSPWDRLDKSTLTNLSCECNEDNQELRKLFIYTLTCLKGKMSKMGRDRNILSALYSPNAQNSWYKPGVWNSILVCHMGDRTPVTGTNMYCFLACTWGRSWSWKLSLTWSPGPLMRNGASWVIC